jgi:hypothetical protein
MNLTVDYCKEMISQVNLVNVLIEYSIRDAPMHVILFVTLVEFYWYCKRL